MTFPVFVAGAGIGGLSAALALSARGHDVIVLERSLELKEVGAGLQLSPNACRILDNFGVLDHVRAAATAPDHIAIGSARQGTEITRIALGDAMTRRYGTPYLVVHRADLQRALFEKARSDPKIEVRFSTGISELDDAGDSGVTCTVVSGGARETLAARAVIGADGVWSTTRQFVPDHAKTRYSGLTAYRATLQANRVEPDLLNHTGLWLGSNAHLVHYPISGGARFNLVALVPEEWTEEGWSAEGSRAELLSHFENWAPSLRRLIDLPENWLKWALCGVDANGPWSSGRLALLGDAAHAMLPFAAQGAAMAIEDAAVLASCFSPSETDIPSAFKAYEAARKPRVKKVQKTAEENGRIYHLGGPVAIGRDIALKLMRPQKLANRQDWIYSWTPPGT
jgi:salicylate hydroxylase